MRKAVEPQVLGLYPSRAMTKAKTSARARTKQSERPRLAARTLVLSGKHVPLLSGAMHYFRHKPSDWRPALESVKALGLAMVETYVPWGVHETSDGTCDFGQRDPQKDLGAFLDLAHSLGLYVFLRPGPHINAELTYFGLPARIIYDAACQARSPRGNPLPFVAPPKMFPIPSTASERFLHETARWFGAVAEVVRPRMWPEGPVVLLQVDNEGAFYFRDAPYDQDYHPDAVAKYEAFLRARYTALETLNAAYDASFAEWSEVAPPQHFEGATHAALRQQLDHMEFHEEVLAGALSRMRAALEAHGLGELPTVHNLPMGEAGLPISLARIDRGVDVAGLDYYHRRSDLRVVKRRTLRMAGSVRFPYAPEMGVGAPMWFAPRSDNDSLLTTLCACAYGIRGINLYMAVDRDRWYGAPIGEDGQPRAHAVQWTRLLSALARVAFHELKRRVEVAIQLPKEYARLTRATHTLGALSPMLLDLAGAGAGAASLQDALGFAAPIQLEWTRFVDRFARALDQAGVPYVYVESDAEPERLAGLRLLITPTFEYADYARWQRIRDFAAAGGTVIYGPRTPHLGTELAPQVFEVPEGASCVEVPDQLDADRIIHSLVDALGLAQPFPVSPRSVDSVVHEDAEGPRVLFLVQPDASSVAAEIRLPEPMVLIDVMTDERFAGEASVTIPLPGHCCRMLICERTRPVSSRPKPPSARRSAS